jgi:hypothetical protein
MYELITGTLYSKYAEINLNTAESTKLKSVATFLSDLGVRRGLESNTL